jgi:hypothetical protein
MTAAIKNYAMLLPATLTRDIELDCPDQPLLVMAPIIDPTNQFSIIGTFKNVVIWPGVELSCRLIDIQCTESFVNQGDLHADGVYIDSPEIYWEGPIYEGTELGSIEELYNRADDINREFDRVVNLYRTPQKGVPLHARTCGVWENAPKRPKR